MMQVMQQQKWLWRPAQTDMPELWLQIGLQPDQIEQLVAITHSDPLVGQTTHDLKRFQTKQSVEQWLQGPRQVLLLLDKAGQIQGIVWFSQKPLPEFSPAQVLPAWQAKVAQFDLSQYQVTFAIRLYGRARGKGLATPLLRLAFERFAPGSKVWLQTKATNSPAIKTYQKAGFQQITLPDAEQEILMLQI